MRYPYYNNNYYHKHEIKDRLPSIGVGVILINLRLKKILLGQRLDSYLYGLPGGYLEFSEEWEEGASRELLEETNIYKKPSSFSHLYTLNCINEAEDFHSISCVMYSEIGSKEAYKLINMEPHKCLKWIWVTLEELRSYNTKLFYPLRKFLSLFPHLKTVDDIKSLIKTKQKQQ